MEPSSSQSSLHPNSLDETILATRSRMLAPPRPHCAFGSGCDSSPTGQHFGPSICLWCKNLSFETLYEQAESHTDRVTLKPLIDNYMQDLEREGDERFSKGWPFLCACKDPEYRFDAWRRTFNPQSARLCGTVRNRGQLCTRCFAKASTQKCSWLAGFERDRLGFPCVFENPALRNTGDLKWKIGPLDDRGERESDWEKDPRRHGRCERARLKNQLCQKCFNRMCEIKSFGRYFDPEWGTLREDFGF